ncbi:hypothetical protein KCTC52924_01332 [Arenibacter antarcticus]
MVLSVSSMVHYRINNFKFDVQIWNYLKTSSIEKALKIEFPGFLFGS